MKQPFQSDSLSSANGALPKLDAEEKRARTRLLECRAFALAVRPTRPLYFSQARAVMASACPREAPGNSLRTRAAKASRYFRSAASPCVEIVNVESTTSTL